MSVPILKVENLSIALPVGADRPLAIEDVNFEIYPEEVLCIVGESGSGKSMSANAIMGLLPLPHVKPVQGQILFENQDLLKLKASQIRNIRGSQISMIFQEPMTALNPMMKIGKQMSEVFQYHSTMSAREVEIQSIQLLEDVGLPQPEKIYHSWSFNLSGGQRQRVMIAMALAMEPKVLIADEPTTALDVTTQAQILKLILNLQKSHKMGVMFITHDFGVVAEIADRVIVMKEGKVVESGTANAVLNQPQHPYTQKLAAAVPHFIPEKRQDLNTPVIFEIKNLDKKYISKSGLWGQKVREVHASNNINFSIRQGETFSIVGESGSGKSTTGRCIVRLIEADQGQVIFEGQDFYKLRDPKFIHEFRRHIQMIFQDPYASLNPRRSVGDAIAEGPIIHGITPAEAYQRVYELLDLVGLPKQAAKRYPHEFSGGQRQRVGIARALALKPQVIIADEAVSALDVSVQEQVLQLLQDIQNQMNLSILFITHDLRVAAKICDRIAVMQFGQIVECGRTYDVFTNPQHDYTKTLLDSIPGKSWIPPKIAAA